MEQLLMWRQPYNKKFRIGSLLVLIGLYECADISACVLCFNQYKNMILTVQHAESSVFWKNSEK